MTKRRFNFGEEFLKLYRESIVTQSLATLLLLSVCAAIWLVPVFQGKLPGRVPPLLAALTGTVMGFWFKGKTQYQAGVTAGQAMGVKEV